VRYTEDEEKSKEALIEELNKLREEVRSLRMREKEFLKREKEIRTLYEAIEQISSIVVLTDKNGIIEYVNPKFSEVTGYSRNEVIGKHTRILKSDRTSPAHYKELWQTILSGKEWKGEFLNRKKNGELYWEGAHIFSIKSLEGEVEHFIKVGEDITHIKRHRKELLNLIVNTCHLINTPLTVALGYIDLVKHHLKTLDAESLEKIYSKLKEIEMLVKSELVSNLRLLTHETYDGWHPVEKDDDSEDELF